MKIWHLSRSLGSGGKRTVYIWVGQDKRDVVAELALTGFASLSEARAGIVEHLKTEGCEGDAAGKVVRVAELADQIEVETERCGFGISNVDIERAIRSNGGTIKI